MVNNLLRLSLKVWNSGMGVGGIATTIYGVCIFRAASSSHHTSIPWFYHAFLFVGTVLCALSCFGHLAANTANTCCLTTIYKHILYMAMALTQRQYVASILVLLMLETLIVTAAFFNPQWVKDLPINQSGIFDDFMSSDYIFKYLAFMLFLVQGICILLAALSIHDHITLGIDGYENEYEDEDEQPRVALIYSIARWQHSDRYIV